MRGVRAPDGGLTSVMEKAGRSVLAGLVRADPCRSGGCHWSDRYNANFLKFEISMPDSTSPKGDYSFTQPEQRMSNYSLSAEMLSGYFMQVIYNNPYTHKFQKQQKEQNSEAYIHLIWKGP